MWRGRTLSKKRESEACWSKMMGKCYAVILEAQYGIDIEKIRRDLRVGANRSLQKYFDIEVLV